MVGKQRAQGAGRTAVLASSAARAGAGRNRKPNSGGGARTKATRNGTAGIVACTGTGWQKPAAEFRQRCSIESNPGAAVLSAKIIHRVPSPYEFVVDRSGSCFATLILSRAGLSPAPKKINLAKRLPSETPLFAQIRCVPKRCSFLRINFVTGWLKGSP